MAEEFKLVHIKMTPSEKTNLAVYAAANGMTMTDVVRKAVKEYLENHLDKNE